MITIEISILISGISVAAALYFGISTKNRNTKKDTQEEASKDATVIVKLESIQTSMIEMKADMKNYSEEIKEMRVESAKREESLKSIHKRVDRMERLIESLIPQAGEREE